MKQPIWLVVAVVIGCGGARDVPDPPKPDPPKPASALAKDDAVFEAVFLYDLAKTTIAADEAVCLATRGATTDGAALVAAIQARYPTTVRDSACSGGGPTGPVVLTATGGKAVRFDIGPIEWNPDGSARVASGGAYRGGGVREVEYTVAKTADGWKVTAEKLLRET